LHGLAAADLIEDEMALIVSINGYDESISSSITTRYTYAAEGILFGHEFVDVLCPLDDGRIALDLTRFHDSRPATSN
jgi:inward rectifier potassium channel